MQVTSQTNIQTAYNRCSPDVQAWVSATPPDILVCVLNAGFMMSRAYTRDTPTQPMCSSVQLSDQSNTTVHKGAIGEMFVMNVLKTKFANVENTSKIAKSGDLTLLIHQHKILVEVKNYKNVVP